MQILGNKILIKEIKSDKTDSGIYLQGYESQKRGEVVAIGKGHWEHPPQVKVGDKVIFTHATAFEGMVLSNEENILAIYE